MQNEIRKAIDSDNETIISEIIPSSVGCILCPKNELPDIKNVDEKIEETYRIESTNGQWLCRSITDPYPLTHPTIFKLKEDGPLKKSYNAHGWSEVVIETREHEKAFEDLNVEEIKNVLVIYINRIKELRKRESVAEICIIKDNLNIDFNHTHSRIITLPLVSKRTREKVRKFDEFFLKYNECLYCELIKNDKQRKILENELFESIAPYTPCNKGEVWILPKKHIRCISELNDFEIFSLSEIIKIILTRMRGIFNPFKYTMAYYLIPTNQKDFHFHIALSLKAYPHPLKEWYDFNTCKESPELIVKLLR